MAKILDSQWNVFSDGQVSDADKVSDNIYKPGVSYSSLENINGHLDRLNVPAASSSEYWQIDGEIVQKGTFSGSSMIGATANMDFFLEPHFQDTFRKNVFGPDLLVDSNNVILTIDGNTPFADDDDFVPVPGANISFYLPYDCSLVLFTWNVQFENDGDRGFTLGTGGDNPQLEPNGLYGDQLSLSRTWLRFYIDDEWVEGQERITHPTKTKPWKNTATIPDSRFLPGTRGLGSGGRYWNGHHAASTSNNTQLTKGWHTAGIRIYGNSNQSRVRVRGIRHVYFR